MAKKSAGLLLFRRKAELEFFLVHPGGPFFKKKEWGVWSIPKGEFTDEDPLEAAKRELQEETGHVVEGKFFELQPIKQKSGKLVYAWAIEADVDERNITCNNFSMEWPPGSGSFKEFPEVDKAAWMNIETARAAINAAQVPLLEEVKQITG